MNRPGSRRDHDRSCSREGWSVVRGARGSAVGHRTTYELALPDGRVLRTRVSRPADGTTYGPGLWRHVLDQLSVTEAEFWACVSARRRPERTPVGLRPPARALPASLVHQLVTVAGVAEQAVAAMTLEEAVTVMTEHWTRPSG